MGCLVFFCSFGIVWNAIPPSRHKKVGFLWPIRKVFLRGRSEKILFNKTHRVQLKGSLATSSPPRAVLHEQSSMRWRAHKGLCTKLPWIRFQGTPGLVCSCLFLSSNRTSLNAKHFLSVDVNAAGIIVSTCSDQQGPQHHPPAASPT